MLRTQDGLLEDEDCVPYCLYEQIREGNTLTVTYLSGQPETHRLGPVEDRRIWRQSGVWLLGMLGGTGIFGFVFLGILRQTRKELRLIRYGISCPGRICDCVLVKNAKTACYTVTYQFLWADGKQRQTCVVSGDVRERLSPGKMATVLYDPANPRVSCLYTAISYAEPYADRLVRG
jgi:hypothetical protein